MKIRSWPWRHTWRLKVQRDTFGEPKAWSKITNLFHSITTYCELRKIRNAAACCAKTRGVRRTCTDMQGQWERVHESEVHGEFGTLWQFVDVIRWYQMTIEKTISKKICHNWSTRGSRLAASTGWGWLKDAVPSLACFMRFFSRSPFLFEKMKSYWYMYRSEAVAPNCSADIATKNDCDQVHCKSGCLSVLGTWHGPIFGEYQLSSHSLKGKSPEKTSQTY
jgi:hypothetical protein